MMANLKKSFKLLRYAYDFKANMGVMAAFLAAITVIYILTFGYGYDLQMLGYILLFLAFMVPLQLKEDLMLSQMLLSSGFRRFFDVNFADVLVLLGSLASFWVNAIVVLLFFKEGTLEGSTIVGLLLTSSCGIGMLTIFQGFIMKKVVASIFLYLLVGICSAITDEIIEDFGLNPSKVLALVIGTCFVLVGNLLAMRIRRKMYKEPLSKHATSEGLKKAMV